MTKARKKRHMTTAEFEAVRPLLSISKDRIDAAYSALVLGEVLQKIADQYGWTRQAVNDAASIVWSTLQAYRIAQQAEVKALNQHLPDGWEMLSIAAPVDLIEKFKKEVARRTE
jgi:hypothetical protein